MVCGRVDGRDRRMGAARRGALARAVVDRAGGPLRWPGLPRRVRRAVLRLSPRATAMGRCDDHRGGPVGDRDQRRQRRALGGVGAPAGQSAVEGAIFALGAALVRISTRRLVLHRAEGLLLGAAAGALFGVSDVAIKYITKATPGPLGGVVSPWMLTAIVAAVIAFYASARSLQIADGLEVIALTSVAATSPRSLGASSCSTSRSARAPLRPRPASSRSAWSSPAPRSCPPRCAPRPRRPDTSRHATERQHHDAPPGWLIRAQRGRSAWLWRGDIRV
jgi:hypothetical protein